MSKKSIEIQETRERVFRRDGYVCQYNDYCLATELELAHRIAKSKANIKMIMRIKQVDRKTAERYIHHDLNLVTSCSKHNSHWNIGNRPGEVEKLLDEISAVIELGKLQD